MVKIISAGIMSKVDSNGRIMIPKGVREVLNIKENDKFIVYFSRDGLYFKKQKRRAGLERH